MSPVGVIESLWRYPVKGMQGCEASSLFLGFSGVFGDRCYAIGDAAARAGFPYLSATGQPRMLGYRPRFRSPERAAQPPNLAEAMSISPGVNPANAGPDDLGVEITAPSGDVFDIDDPALLEALAAGLRGEHSLSLVRSDRALTDCRPLSLIGLPTIRQIGDELGAPLDKRRFRANVYFDPDGDEGFVEDGLVGRRLRLGDRATIAVLERDPRCKAISLDPSTGEHDPAILRSVATEHDACAGIYAAVLIEGVVNVGDPIAVLD